MERPSYLSKYNLDWNILEDLFERRSALDLELHFGASDDVEGVNRFLKGYGFDPFDPVQNAELFGNYQEAIQFIKRYLLTAVQEDGIELMIPTAFYTITDIRDLILMAAVGNSEVNTEEHLWAGIILKVMHTIIHADKDLRYRYFAIIQQQILDRIYKYLIREQDNKLYLGTSDEDKIMLEDFQTKAKKTRDSIIVKFLCKGDNVAEELFDRIGIRFITDNRFDTLRVINFLRKQHILIPHNLMPNRTINTLIDLEKFQQKYDSLLKIAERNDLSEKRFLDAAEREMADIFPTLDPSKQSNVHTSGEYRSIHFTCRQLIKYRDPFMSKFYDVRELAKDIQGEISEDDKSEATERSRRLVNKIINLDTSSLAREIRFFYPFEIQITDKECNHQNSEGEASHQKYKQAQRKTAMMRLCSELLEYKKEQQKKG